MRRLALALLLWAGLSGPALAANCAPFSFTLTNGQVADATQVMSNFNNLLNCSNNNLAHNGTNSDITQLTGITTPITVPEGGTGLGTLTSNALVVGNGGSTPLFIVPGSSGNVVTSNGTAWASGALRSYLAGLTLSNDGTNPNTTLDIAAGTAADSTNAAMMTIAAFTKNTSGTFVAGSGNAGLDTGTIAASTFYHVFLIMRADTNATDILFSLSATAPTMPANYTLKRRVGSFQTDASANILAFVQLGDEFLFKTPQGNVNTTTLGITGALFAISVPNGIQVRARMRVLASNAAAWAILITSPDETDRGVGTTPGDETLTQGAAQSAVAEIITRTNTSQQIRARSTAASTTFQVATYGWFDDRGKQN